MSNAEKQDTKLNTENENEFPQLTCSNCQAVISGPYCSQCGQSCESNIKYFWSVILHLLDSFFSFDSRVSRTLYPLLTRPGFLTNQYIQGRRVRYVPPLRLYLFISIVFFIILKFFVASENNISTNTDEKALTQVSNHIAELELQYEVLISETKPENQESQLQAIELTKQELHKFKTYHNDLSESDNKILKALTTELVSLEFAKLDSNQPLSDENQEQYTNLTKQLPKVRKGEKVNILGIGNSSDGALSFSFLPAEKNQILNDFANQLEEKFSEVIQNDSGPQLLQHTISKLPQLMFVLLPLFAVILKIMYLFSNRFYMEHLTVALHSHSFLFLVILLLEMLNIVQHTFLKSSPLLNSLLMVVFFSLLVWIPIYLFIMQKRVYKQGYFVTTTKYLIIGIAYMSLITLAAFVAFVWGLIDL